MEEQDKEGDQSPLYSQSYDNPQQQHGIVPSSGASYYNGTAPFNGENHNNNNHYRQEQAHRQTLQQEQFQMVPQTKLQMLRQTHSEIQIQQQHIEMEIQRARLQRRQHWEQRNNVNMNGVSQSNGRPRNLRKHADNRNELFNETLPQQNQNVDLQQNQNVNVHTHQQQHDMDMQFEQRHDMEMEIQQMQLLQQHNIEQSNNVNVNVVSQSTEIVTASQPVTQTDGEKRKRERPRKLSNQADSRASKLPLGSTETPRGLQFEYGQPGRFRVIAIAPGEDVHEKIMSFYQQTPLTVCIISAKGTISNVDFQEIEPRRIVNHKGEFEILSLSRSYTKDNNGLRVTLVHLDGKIFRGIVGGLLIAASSVEVVVGVFPSSAVYIPEQVGNEGPIDNVRALTTEIPISISGEQNTQVYSANDTNEGNLQKLRDLSDEQLPNRKLGV